MKDSDFIFVLCNQLKIPPLKSLSQFEDYASKQNVQFLTLLLNRLRTIDEKAFGQTYISPSVYYKIDEAARVLSVALSRAGTITFGLGAK